MRMEIRSLLDECVEIDDQVHVIKNMTSQSLHDTTRREPISVRVNLRSVSAGASSLLAGLAISDPLTRGVVVLLTLGSSVIPTTEKVKPNSALTYGVGWELSDREKLFVEKDYLVEETIDASQNTEEISDMTETDVENAIQDLLTMGCITREKVDEKVIIWFEEKFEAEYTVR